MMKKLRFTVAIVLFAGIFSVISQAPSAMAAVGDNDTSTVIDGTHYFYSTVQVPEYDSGTIEVWVKTNSACITQTVLFGTDHGFIGCIGGLWETGIQGSSWTDSIQSVSSWTPSATMPILPEVVANAWTHIAITWNKGGNYNFYINGQLSQIITTSLDRSSNANYLYLGQFNNHQNWTGQLDDFQYWRGVRTLSQIQSDLNSVPNYSDANLLAYYDFNDASGNVTNRATSANSFQTNGNLVSTGVSFSENSSTDTPGVPGYTVVKFVKPYLTANGGWKVPANVANVDYLIVGGGGGAGYNSGGGGSGGGVDSGTVAISGNVNVQVGLGGAGGYLSTVNGSNGFATIFASKTISGGNGGTSWTTSSTSPAGGSSVSGSGAGGYGSKNNGYAPQAGFNGPTSSITGTATNYAGGGGGGAWVAETGVLGGAGGGGKGGGAAPGNTTRAGDDGSPNTGGGGGSNSSSTLAAGGSANAGFGGSGVVIIKYKNYFGASISISVNPKKTTKSSAATPITATTTSTGTVTFYANGRVINGCMNVPVSGTTATCNWRPITQGQVTLTATYTSNDPLYSGTAAATSFVTSVGKRTSAR
jgi:hypothetical protein